MSQPLKKMLNRIGWLCLIFAASMLIISAVERKQVESCNGVLIDVQPLEFDRNLINEQDVEAVILKKYDLNISGLKLSDIDIESLETLLKAEPFVFDAEAYFDGENNLNVKIEQRRPILRVIDNNGMDYYLDSDGCKMPPSKRYTARVLVATGDLPPYTENFRGKENHLLKDLYLLTNYILHDHFLNNLIEQVHVNKGDFILVPKLGNQKILLGSISDIEGKFDRLKVFYKEGMSREGWTKYKTINLKFKNQVVCEKA